MGAGASSDNPVQTPEVAGTFIGSRGFCGGSICSAQRRRPLGWIDFTESVADLSRVRLEYPEFLRTSGPPPPTYLKSPSA
jgi:hypothetical protein